MELLYISKWGGTFNLTDNEHMWLINADGLTKATTSLSTIAIGGVDGDMINSVRAQPRGIVLDLRAKRHQNVEQAKRAVLEIVKLKQTCTLKWTQNNRVWTISGIVDSIEMPRFNNKVTMQIGIHCSQPYWEDLNEIISEINEAKPLHYFTDDPLDMLFFPEDGIPLGELDTSRTRTFFNAGDVAVGMIIEVLAYARVVNPIIHDQNGKFFGVGYGTGDFRFIMEAGDKLVINTNAGQKNVTYNGESVLNAVRPQSTWLQFQAGENEYSISDDSGSVTNMTFNLVYRQRFI